jgi:hypothetical protein
LFFGITLAGCNRTAQNLYGGATGYGVQTDKQENKLNEEQNKGKSVQ